MSGAMIASRKLRQGAAVLYRPRHDACLARPPCAQAALSRLRWARPARTLMA